MFVSEGIRCKELQNIWVRYVVEILKDALFAFEFHIFPWKLLAYDRDDLKII